MGDPNLRLSSEEKRQRHFSKGPKTIYLQLTENITLNLHISRTEYQVILESDRQPRVYAYQKVVGFHLAKIAWFNGGLNPAQLVA